MLKSLNQDEVLWGPKFLSDLRFYTLFNCTTCFHLRQNKTIFFCSITTREQFLEAAYKGDIKKVKQLMPKVNLDWKEKGIFKVSSESCSTSRIKGKGRLIKHFFSDCLAFVWVYDLAPFDTSDKALLSHTYPLFIGRKMSHPDST